MMLHASVPKLETCPCFLSEGGKVIKQQMYSMWLRNGQEKESEMGDLLHGNSLHSQKLALK